MQIQTVFKAGNSEVIAVPALLRRQIGIKIGSKVVVDVTSDGKAIIVSKAGSEAKLSTVTPQFLQVLEKVNKRYGPALRKLANL